MIISIILKKAPSEAEVKAIFTDDVIISKLHAVGQHGEVFLEALHQAAEYLRDIFPREELFDRFSSYIFNYILSGFSEDARNIIANMKSKSKPYKRVFYQVKKIQKLLRVQMFGLVENIMATPTSSTAGSGYYI